MLTSQIRKLVTKADNEKNRLVLFGRTVQRSFKYRIKNQST